MTAAFDLSGFEKFMGRRRKAPEGVCARLRINTQGRHLILNKVSYRSLGRPQRVEFLVSRQRGQIALRPVAVGGHAVTVNQTTGQAVISCAELIREFSLKTGGRRLQIENGVLVFDMQPMEDVLVGVQP